MTTQPRPSRFARLAGDLSGDDTTSAPLLLIHGLTYDRRSWQPVVSELRRIDPDRRVLSIDLPGHGQSRDERDFELEHVVDQLHAAADDAGLAAPVVVGHSAGGLAATVYAAAWPTSGVINVDQPLEVGGFAAHLRSRADRLRSPDFAAVWDEIVPSLGIDRLPAQTRELLRVATTPTQDIFLGYWSRVLTGSLQELAALADLTLTSVREAEVPYTHLAGEELGPYREWLAARLPDATIVTWPGSGHFVHLAHPRRFAELLCRTAAWPRASSLTAC